MKFAAILPHTKLYGGVKRFFELGDIFQKKGYTFIVFTPDGIAPTWYTGGVQTVKLEELPTFTLEAIFITETQYLPEIERANAKRKILYFVRPSDNLRILRKYPTVEVFANSTNAYETVKSKYRIEAFKAFGGINTNTFQPKVIVKKGTDEPFVIMTYGRLVEKKKGTRLVVKACEKLYKAGYNIKLLLFDTPVNEKAQAAIDEFTTNVPFEFVVNHPVNKNQELFHRADIYVSAEKKAGHSNTTAEAMACGIPVVGTESGTRDFLIHSVTGIVVSRWSWRIASALRLLMQDFELRETLAKNGRKKIEEFSWDALAERILKHLGH
ncbi:glycosyltransferase family 4 protein [Ohtaekwangia koreensis]|uniref:Glycosyl transferases group 1 n=1 Tax=Ohtaekwangia koreensis TaxID=688867 RepID=A0A1T5K8Z6_9BACT|nr:glycosyltransferase family 4 protein [Ohtaekwangia koreensis]SKC60177.1 Glycosyl transferases group 1 [Ohtaekwangia koreensis]